MAAVTAAVGAIAIALSCGGAVALIICANVLWTLYGILRGSIWLTLPSAIHTVFGLFMAWAKRPRKDL